MRDCKGDGKYRIWSGDAGALDVCQAVAGAPTTSAISCEEFTNGGFDGPNGCADVGEGNFYAYSVAIDDTTQIGGDTAENVFCQFYASPVCDNVDQSPQEACLNPYGDGAQSFKCVSAVFVGRKLWRGVKLTVLQTLTNEQG